MSDDLGMQFQVSIVVFLLGALCACVINVTVLAINYMENYADKYVWAVTETEYKNMLTAFSESPGNPMSGALIYKLLMNAGLIFDSIKVYDLDGNLVRQMSRYDADYSEEKILNFVTEFVKRPDMYKYYEGTAEFEYSSGLYRISLMEVDPTDE